MDNIRVLIRDIQAGDLALGTLADEAYKCSIKNKYMASLACLFILAEQSIKLANEKNEGNLNEQIEELKKKGKISVEQYHFLNQLRTIRNKLFHENHYMWVVDDRNGKATFFSEQEAKKSLWESLCIPTFEICRKLLEYSEIKEVKF